MNFLKIAWSDISSIFKNRFIRVSVIAIIIVPLLYSLLYLAAFWDPYSRLDKLPIAFVNLDKGTTKDGNTVNYGQDLVDNLKNNKEVQWNFVNLNEGEDGVKNDKYYSIFIIPENFSTNILSAKDGTPQQAKIIYSANEKKNFLSAQIGQRVEDKLKAEIISNITEEYTKVTFDSIYEIRDGMEQASNGSKELYDGVSKLNGKIPEMTDGINKLYNGSTDLNNGLNQLKKNAPAMQEGANKLYEGSTALKGGLEYLNSNASNLGEGTQKLLDGTAQLSEGINTSAVVDNKPVGLTDGLKALSEGMNSAKDGVEELGKSLESLNKAVNIGGNGEPSLVQGVTKINNGVNSLGSAAGVFNKTVNNGNVPQTNGMNNEEIVSSLVNKYSVATNSDEKVAILSQMIAVLNTAINVDESSINPSLKTAVNSITNNITIDSQGKPSLGTSIRSLNEAVNNGYNGKSSLKSGINEADSATKSLVQGSMKIGQGAESLNKGIKELSSNIPALTGGVDKLAQGATDLNSGIGQLKGKMPELSAGVNALSSGSVELNNGLRTLNDKMPELKDGAQKLDNGSKELATKLKEGSDKINNNIVNTSDDMANFVSNPIKLDDTPTNAVKDYGTGFTPYFIPLSLWVGAIMMFFVISARVENSANAGAIAVVTGKYLSYSFIGVLQAVLASLAVLALGLKPENIPLYFAFNILMSLAFIAIMQCLISVLGDAGRLLAIVLLILQLTSCAGTFPLELVPDFFKVLNPFMPFTYCVSGLREIISGTSNTIIARDAGILFAITIVFLTISVILKERGEKLQQKMEERKEAIAN